MALSMVSLNGTIVRKTITQGRWSDDGKYEEGFATITVQLPSPVDFRVFREDVALKVGDTVRILIILEGGEGEG